MISRLSVENLALERGGRRLFESLSLTVQAGEAVALTGSNGAGKTSLLRAVAGLLRPAAGSIGFEGPGVLLEPEEARSEGLHLIGHYDGLKGGRTAGEELSFWSAWTGGAPDAALDVLDLRPLLGLEVRKLSAGQRRRLALARLITSPRALWLLDEPLAPLDARMRGKLGELMAAHVNGGGMILAAVHDPLPITARETRIGS
jgi:heme exporter protein A